MPGILFLWLQPWRRWAVGSVVGLYALAGLTGCGYVPETPQYIHDSQGRALVFHGLNTSNSAKYDPQRLPWITEPDVEREVKNWGFNFVRLLIFWDAIEPQPGQIDTDYLDQVAERVTWYTERGMYVMLDMHQDLYSGVFFGDGAPAWAVDTCRRDENGNIIRCFEPPTEPLDPWWLLYAHPAVMTAFDNFWDYAHSPMLQDHYFSAWQAVAARFAANPGVIGYDLMNEPSGGSKLRPTQFEPTRLQPFYARLISAIRAVDTDKWLFYEPQALGVSFGLPSALGVLDDPRPGENRLVYIPHFYPVRVHEGGGFDGDLKSFKAWARARAEELNGQLAPLVIGEFGLPPQPGDELFVDYVTVMADLMGGGWTYWDSTPGSWGPLDENLNENPLAGWLVRVYPRAIAGAPVSFIYNPETRVFELVFDEKAGVTGPTEIYIPAARHFPTGWQLEVVSEGGYTWEWDDVYEILRLTTTADDGLFRYQVTIRPN